MRKKNCSIGFTLIEVLITLAILSIALTAIIRSTSQNIRDTTYLQNKNIAEWVGTEVINEARVGLLTLPFAPATREKKITLLNRQWLWQASMNQTPNPRINKITVSVYQPHDDTELIQLVSYLYVS